MRTNRDRAWPRSFNVRIGIGILAVGAILGATTAVNALNSKGSRQISQSTSGISGSARAGDFFAASLAVGDFDRDGYDDVIAGVPYENLGTRKRDSGVVHVLYGSRSGIATNNDISLNQGSPGVKGKSKRDDLFGSAVAVGDFNKDGYDDAVIGVPGKDRGASADAGSVTILYGYRGGLRGKGSKVLTAASKGVKGKVEPFANLGWSLAVGDFNGDGYDDVAVGAPGSGGAGNYDSGAVHIFYGGKSGVTASGNQRIDQSMAKVAGSRESGDGFGTSLAAGDFNNDGRDDLAVGIPGKTVNGQIAAGAVEIFSGSRSGLVLTSGVVVTQAKGRVAGDPLTDNVFGTSLAAADFNGDRRDDLAIGAPGEAVSGQTAAGRVHVLYGTKAGLDPSRTANFSQASKGIKSKPEAGDEFGMSLAVGNFNGRGPMDLAIGAPGEGFGSNIGSGVVHIISGSRKGLRSNRHQWFSPGRKGIPGKKQPNAGFSRAVAAGDIDGDGRDDLVVGSPGTKVGRAAAAGALTLIFG